MCKHIYIHILFIYIHTKGWRIYTSIYYKRAYGNIWRGKVWYFILGHAWRICRCILRRMLCNRSRCADACIARSKKHLRSGKLSVRRQVDIYVRVCVCVRVYVGVYMYIYIQIFTHLYIRIYTHTHIHIYIHIYMCVYTYICIYL